MTLLFLEASKGIFNTVVGESGNRLNVVDETATGGNIFTPFLYAEKQKIGQYDRKIYFFLSLKFKQ